MPDQPRDRWIQLIGVVKVLKSLALFTLATIVLVLSRHDVADSLTHWAFVLGISPGNHLLKGLIDQIEPLAGSKLRMIAAAMGIYGVLFAIEGVGLLMRKRWGEWVTIVITGSFIPLEVYETVLHPHLTRVLTIALNVAAVGYLVYRVRPKHLPLSNAASSGKDAPPA